MPFKGCVMEESMGMQLGCNAGEDGICFFPLLLRYGNAHTLMMTGDKGTSLGFGFNGGVSALARCILYSQK